jgi:hypothetical protein
MKIFALCFLCFSLILSTGGCGELPDYHPPLTPPDYREAFEGNYTCIRSCTTWMMGQPSVTHTDTLSVIVTLVDSISDHIMIDGNEAVVDSAGDFSGIHNTAGSGFHLLGSFSAGDSLTMSINSGGLGGGTNCYYLGRK